MSNANDMAFPVVLETTRTPNDSEQLGLNKREYFAAMAMQGYCANPEVLHWSHEEMAEHAVEAADHLCVAIEETKSL